MDGHVEANVHEFVILDGARLGLVHVARAAGVVPLLNPTHTRLDNDVDVWHHTLHSVCDNDLQADIHVPLGHVIGKWTIESFPEFVWVELRHIGVHNQDNETSIEELAYEGSLDDRALLLRHGILTNP